MGEETSRLLQHMKVVTESEAMRDKSLYKNLLILSSKIRKILPRSGMHCLMAPHKSVLPLQPISVFHHKTVCSLD